MIFADAEHRAHARRWTNRQSAHSAIRDETGAVLIVAEALHGSAAADVKNLMAAVAEEFRAVWSITPHSAMPDASSPRFGF